MYGAGASRKVEANGDESCVGGVASGSRGTRLLGRLGADRYGLRNSGGAVASL
jgi:hypothetical protein